jgi:hypothetical protein
MHMTRKQTAWHWLLQLRWPPWLLLPPLPLQVSSFDDCVSQPVPEQARAYLTLLCAARAAVQVRICRSLSVPLIDAQMGTGCAGSAPLSSALASRTGRMKAAERTTHAYDGSAVLMLLPPRHSSQQAALQRAPAHTKGRGGLARRARP